MSVILRARLTERVEQYAARNPEASRAEVLGRFRLDPDEESEERALVEDVLDAANETTDTPRALADGGREERMNGDSVRRGRLVPFGEHNATRRCNADECDADAVGDLATETVSTAFVCRDHADLVDSDPGALAAALGGEA